LETVAPNDQAAAPQGILGAGATAAPATASARVRKLVALFTAAAFQNRRLGGASDLRGGERGHALWADAWDRVASLVRGASTERDLARLAADLEREARVAKTGEWRAVCTHAAQEISRLAMPGRPD
jgi:hypothetical protein